MDYSYPDRICDDDLDDEISLAEVEKIQDCEGKRVKKSKYDDRSFNEQHPSAGESNDDEDVPRVSRDAETNSQGQQNRHAMAVLIQQERNRRLGIRNVVDFKNQIAYPAAPFSGRVLGNIRGWFVGASGAQASENGEKSNDGRASTSAIAVSKDAPLYEHQIPEKVQSMKDKSHVYNSSSSTSSDDSSSIFDDSSISSNTSNPNHGASSFTPQERAREHALRYLSNTCVDAGRKSKVASYVWGLERLDLKRKRDRYAKELEIVESEMNKDHGLISHAGERDAISDMAVALVREFPRIHGADAGAGIDLIKETDRNASFMTWEEYIDAINSDDWMMRIQHPSVWENKEAFDVYMTSLQRRLKDAMDRTRSLEKRLVVLENAGDDIVSSLCEDLAEITEYSYKMEAQYIKKGKELQRKRRREERRLRTKIKQAEQRVSELEEKMMIISGVNQLVEQTIGYTDLYEGSDVSTKASTTSGIDDDDDEILLETKLSSIKAYYEQEKNEHKSEVDSIRRQCEQLKLHLSVARLVMEGDDNLRDYMVVLERFDPSQRIDRTYDVFNNQDLLEVGDSIIPSPPSRVTRARAKLLKVIHLEKIYEQRLAVSKAFTDATISALDQELLERESSSQKMEVRCLNELVVIDSEMKNSVNEATDILIKLESEAQELQDAISGANWSSIDLLMPAIDDEIITKNNLSSDILLRAEDCLRQFETKQLPETDLSSKDDLPLDSRMSQPVTKGTFSMVDITVNERDYGGKHGDYVISSNDNVDRSDVTMPKVIDNASLPIGEGNEVESMKESRIADVIVADLQASSHIDNLSIFQCKSSLDGISPVCEYSGDEELSETRNDKKLSVLDPPGRHGLDPWPSRMGECDDKTGASKKAVLEQLGCELKNTLEAYQASYHLPSSKNRVQQLDDMNDLVLKIGQLFGTKGCLNNSVEVAELTSWSFKKSRKFLDGDHREHKHSKKKKRKSRVRAKIIPKTTDHS